MNFRLLKRGFTIIELLVVVAIIAILVAIIAAVVINQVNKAKYARVEADLAQFEKVLFVARGQTGQIASQITGNWCSRCICAGDLKNIPENNTCYTNWISALNAIQAAAGSEFAGIKSMTRDPWGSPYLFDESENENPPICSPDYISSAGPDGLWGTSDDKNLIIPPGYCSL